jgi:hypothetical protein
MKDAIVSFLTLGIVCFILWSLMSIINVFVDVAVSTCLTNSQAWFCVGFAVAVSRPWDPILGFTSSIWKHLNDMAIR